MKAERGIRDVALLFFNLGVAWGRWLTLRPGRFTSEEINPVCIAQEAGCSPETIWSGTKNLVATGFRSPEHPARSHTD